MGPGLATEQSETTDRVSARPPSVEARQLVLVPRDVGHLVRFGPGSGGSPDELDEFVDDVFGPSTDERPGPFDLVLVIAGVIVLGWALLTGAAAWIAVGAVVAIVLGLALPGRAVVRRYRGVAENRRLRAASRRGYLLDVSARPTMELVRAYEDLETFAGLPGSIYGGRALDAAHAALVEAASLLDGAPPRVAAQDAYLEKRTEAIVRLTRQLRDAHESWLAGQAATAAAEDRRRERWVTAVTEARAELQAEDRQGSLARLARLTRRVEREADDDVG